MWLHTAHAPPANKGIGAILELEVNFSYDVFGNRVAKIVDDDGVGANEAVETRFAVDGWNPAKGTPVGNENYDVLADLNGDNSLATRYLRGDTVDQLLGRVEKSGMTLTPYWNLADHLGSVRDVLDGSGDLANSLRYDSFGNVDDLTELHPEYRGRYAWTGREFDVETGLQYNRARYYDAATGRWISQDPMGFDAGDSNLYRYIINKPTNGTDPTGFRNYTTGDSDPSITFDKGAGKWGAELENPTNKTIGRLAIFIGWKDLFLDHFQKAATKFPGPDATTNMKHFLDNSGTTLTIDLKKMIREVPSANTLLLNELVEAMQFASRLGVGKHQITSKNTSIGNNGQAENANWFFAVGGYSAFGKGVANVKADNQFELDFTYEFRDRYNWDAGKSVTLLGKTITDEFMQNFHKLGIAQEYNMVGSLTIKVSWTGDARLAPAIRAVSKAIAP